MRVLCCSAGCERLGYLTKGHDSVVSTDGTWRERTAESATVLTRETLVGAPHHASDSDPLSMFESDDI